MPRRRVGAEIDITPLIDILFMLIIFFVLASSFVQGRLRVELPRAEGEAGKPDGAVLVTLKEDGGLLWGDEPITSPDLFRRLETFPQDEELLVAGDRGAAYGQVVELLDGMRRAGLARVDLALQGALGAGRDAGHER